MTRDLYCYSVDSAGYCYGPYVSEVEAERVKDPDEAIVWLHYNEIDEHGYRIDKSSAHA